MASSLAAVTAERSRPAFSIDRILGLDVERPGNCGVTLHRPWTGLRSESRGTGVCLKQQQQQQQQQLNSPKPASNWYVGRRPRTAFTDSQVNVLETVFQVNCYPGIQLREQLAERLELDEDRIQIWFQNRRAKLRRALRETRLRLVRTAVADLRRVGCEVKGRLEVTQVRQSERELDEEDEE